MFENEKKKLFLNKYVYIWFWTETHIPFPMAGGIFTDR